MFVITSPCPATEKRRMFVAQTSFHVSLLCPPGGNEQSPHRRSQPASQQAHPVDEDAYFCLFYPSALSLRHHAHTPTHCTLMNLYVNEVWKNSFAGSVLVLTMNWYKVCVFCLIHVPPRLVWSNSRRTFKKQIAHRGSDWLPVTAIWYQICARPVVS